MSDNNFLINYFYPMDYLNLKGVPDPPPPNTDPWVSASRYAAVAADGETYLTTIQGGSQTSEILEIDLGYVRTINYAIFDIQIAPVTITLEYDVVSSSDQTRSWAPVTPMAGMPFNDTVQFTPQVLHGWFNAEMYFTDAKKNPVQTRYLRFTFKRTDPWPGTQTAGTHPMGLRATSPPGQFRWPISIRNLRTGLFTVPNPGGGGGGTGQDKLGVIEATGLLFQQEPIGLIPFFPDVDTNIAGGKTSTQLRQRFVIPDGAIRGTGSDAVIPTILGFGIFVNVPIPILIGDIGENYLADEVKFGWELWNVTDPTHEYRTHFGVEKGATVFGDQWLDVYFERPETPGSPPGKIIQPPTHSKNACGVWSYNAPGANNDGHFPCGTFYWSWNVHAVDGEIVNWSLIPPDVPYPDPNPIYFDGKDPKQLKYATRQQVQAMPGGIACQGGVIHACYPIEYEGPAPPAPNTPASKASVATPEKPASAPLPPVGSTVQHCGYWILYAFQTPAPSANVRLAICWYDATDHTYSITAPKGAPPPPEMSGAILSTPVTLPPGIIKQSATFCWDITSYPPPPPPPGGKPGANIGVYELRVWSMNTDAADQFYLSEPNNLSSRALPGTLTFVFGSTSVTTSEDLTSKLKENDWIMIDNVFATVESGDTPLAYQVLSLTSSTLTLDRAYAQTSVTTTAFIVYPLIGWDGAAYIADGQQNMAMRLWGDTGASGEDVLSNSYRYATKEKQADNVLVNSQSGWLSAPMPSQNAIEALYFDLRGLDEDDNPIYQVIDGIKIAPLTPGIQMSMYFSQSNLLGDAPKTVDDWDYLLWTPISNNSFVLNRKSTIRFPHQIKASYLKLEFTALQPLPYTLPTFPPLPPQIYRRYPTWIEEQFNNSGVRQTVQEWWLRNSTPVERQILNELRDPIREFEYEEGLMFAGMALNNPPANTTVVPPIPPIDVRGNNTTTNTNASTTGASFTEIAPLDPITGGRIWLQGPPNRFAGSLLANVDQSSVLGKTVIKRFDPSLFTHQSERLPPPIPASTVPSVSSPHNRITDAFSFLANTPMRFNQTCRHVYRQEWGNFNKKAFFAGINHIEFLRDDYTVKHDDYLIRDILHDDLLLSENTWMRSASSNIPDGSTIFVSYRVDGTDYVDEEVTLNGSLAVQLEGKGPHLYNMLVYSLHQKLGEQYFENEDYTLSLGIDENGVRTYSISRSALTARLDTPPHPMIYADSAVVMGVGHPLPGNTWEDGDTVMGVGLPVTYFERLGLDTPSYGENTYGTGTYGELA